MIARQRLAIAAAAALLFAGACQKVPLLAPSGSTITLTSGASVLPVNGTATIVAQLIEASGSPPHSGTLVTFTTTLGSIEPSQARTDVNGQVAVTFNSGTQSGTATITATSGAANVGTNGAVKIAIGSAAVGRVNVTANPSAIPATGGQATITTTVLDINGNPLPSTAVSFSTTAGTLADGVKTTDSTGTARTILTTTTQATVTASVGAQGSTGTNPPVTTPTPGTPTAPTPGGSTAGQASGTVTVTILNAPTLVITPPTTPPTAGLPAAFTFAVTAATSNGSAVKDLSLNWGDGTVQDLGAVTGSAIVNHVYRSAGSYTITATLADVAGNVNSTSSGVVVNAAALPITITPPSTTPQANLPANFTIVVGTLPTGDSVRNVHIDWGDGTSMDLGALSGSTTISHIFKKADSYIVTATISDTAGNSSTVSTVVVVLPQNPIIGITTSSVVSGTSNTITFTAVVTPSDTQVATYQWDFGDGAQQTTTTPTTTHVYQVATGTKTVRLTVTTTTGQTSSTSTTVTP